MHAMQVVKQVAKLYHIRLVIELIFFGFHGISSLKPFNPYRVGRQTRNLAITLDMSANLIQMLYHIFL